MNNDLISRTALAAQLHVRPATIAKWTRQGWFPAPEQWISARVILYRATDVDAALAARASRMPRPAPRPIIL